MKKPELPYELSERAAALDSGLQMRSEDAHIYEQWTWETTVKELGFRPGQSWCAVIGGSVRCYDASFRPVGEAAAGPMGLLAVMITQVNVASMEALWWCIYNLGMNTEDRAGLEKMTAVAGAPVVGAVSLRLNGRKG